MRLPAALSLSIVFALTGLAASPLEAPAVPTALPEAGAYRLLDRQAEDFDYVIRPDKPPADGMTTAWVIMAAGAPETSDGDSPSYIGLYNQIDCIGMRRRILGTVFYNDRDQIMPIPSQGSPWQDVIPVMPGNDLVELACHPEKDATPVLDGLAGFRADLRARRQAGSR